MGKRTIWHVQIPTFMSTAPLKQVHQYLEDYERALVRGFEAASVRDLGLHADHEVNKLVNLRGKLEDLIMNEGRLKARRLSSILSPLRTHGSVGAHRQVSVGELKDGFNKGVGLQAKTLEAVSHDNSVPLFYLVADREASCIALPVYAFMHCVMERSERALQLP